MGWVGVAQVAKPARLRGVVRRTGRVGNLRYVGRVARAGMVGLFAGLGGGAGQRVGCRFHFHGLEGFFAFAVREREAGGLADVRVGDGGGGFPGGDGAGRAHEGKVAARAVELEAGAERGGLRQRGVVERDGGKAGAGVGEAGAELLRGGILVVGECERVGFVGEAAADGFDAERVVGGRGDMHAEAEAVEELGA
jgi:hypothetical protein